jgi:hypothetical protein
MTGPASEDSNHQQPIGTTQLGIPTYKGQSSCGVIEHLVEEEDAIPSPLPRIEILGSGVENLAPPTA